ncbi:MAG TPA: ABC transporter substrate-binding protein [Sphingomicrobium sp.]|nr:ABC transporter substrate-binding protein [Sphingomicrobium sp.]
MRRRAFLIGLAFAAPIRAAAQDASRIPRIGFLGNSTPELEANLVQPFRDGLRDLGHVEGKNLVIEYRWAEGRYDRFPDLIAELVATKVGMIATAGTPASLAVKRVAPSLPLVMIAIGDPIGSGLAESLARPGGNATGLTSISQDLEGKRLEILKEALPSARRLAVLTNPTNPYLVRDEQEVRIAASALGLPTVFVPVTRAEDLGDALERIRSERADVMLVPADRLFLHGRERIAEFSAMTRMPVISAYREIAEAGGLISFGPSRRHAQAGRALRGQDPEGREASGPADRATRAVRARHQRQDGALVGGASPGQPSHPRRRGGRMRRRESSS